MSGEFKRKGERGTRYSFLNDMCIEADCWSPGHYQSRGATMSGSRNTGNSTPCCMRRAYHGCPTKIVHIGELSKQRKSEGWSRA